MARFVCAAPDGLTVNAVFRRQSDGYYWNGSSGAWQAAAYNNSMTYLSAMGYYYYETDDADFVNTTSDGVAVQSGSTVPLAVFGWRDYYLGGSESAATSWSPTLADLKLHLGISDTSDDTWLDELRVEGKDLVERYCDRRFASSSRTYVVSGDGTERLYLPDWPITAITSIYGPCGHYPRHFTSTSGSVSAAELVNSNYYIIGGLGTGYENNNYILNIASGSPYTDAAGVWDFGHNNFEVVATTGYSTIPGDLYVAAIYCAAHIYNTSKHGRLGLSAKSVDSGNVSYELEYGLPSTVRMMLDKYKRYSFGH